MSTMFRFGLCLPGIVVASLSLPLIGAHAQGDRAAWVKGLAIKVSRESAIYSAPNEKSRILRPAFAKEILTSVGHPPKGWFEVYYPNNQRGYIRFRDAEKWWGRDGKGRLEDAWVGYHDARSDYYYYQIVNPAASDEGESVPLRVARFFTEPSMHLTEDSVTKMGPLAMTFVLGKLDDDAFKSWPAAEAASLHRKAVGLLASYGPSARSGILYLLNQSSWRDQLHATEAMSVVTERLAWAEHGDPRIIGTWVPGMGGFGEVARPGMYYAGEAPAVRGLPEDHDIEELRTTIQKDPALTQKVYVALRKFYALGRSKDLVDRMKSLLHSKHAALRQAAARALKPLGKV